MIMLAVTLDMLEKDKTEIENAFKNSIEKEAIEKKNSRELYWIVRNFESVATAFGCREYNHIINEDYERLCPDE